MFRGFLYYRYLNRAPYHIRVGRLGEIWACKLIREMGLPVLAQNYLAPHGEIDLVARDGEVLCFIEVKTRSVDQLLRPAQAVDFDKMKHIKYAANHYLKHIGNPVTPIRYDVIEVFHENLKLKKIVYRPNFQKEKETPLSFYGL
ncbi:MAG: YraN family protein [Lentisphaeria bacterium]|nr:YraN family protein [Lentisphaeria bacterium]